MDVYRKFSYDHNCFWYDYQRTVTFSSSYPSKSYLHLMPQGTMLLLLLTPRSSRGGGSSCDRFPPKSTSDTDNELRLQLWADRGDEHLPKSIPFRSQIWDPRKASWENKIAKKLNFVFWSPKSKNKLIVIVNGGHEKQNWIFLWFYFLRGPAFCFRMECAASGQQLCRKIPPKSANHRSYIFGAFGVPS